MTKFLEQERREELVELYQRIGYSIKLFAAKREIWVGVYPSRFLMIVVLRRGFNIN